VTLATGTQAAGRPVNRRPSRSGQLTLALALSGSATGIMVPSPAFKFQFKFRVPGLAAGRPMIRCRLLARPRRGRAAHWMSRRGSGSVAAGPPPRLEIMTPACHRVAATAATSVALALAA
jgi:hypothetical protein